MNWKSILRLKSVGVVLALALAVGIPVGYVAATENDFDGGHYYHIDHFIMDPIKTDAGWISGTIVDAAWLSGTRVGDIGKEVRVYRGIPYAARPLGDLRWKPPQPVVPWTGIRECTQFAKWPPQTFPLLLYGNTYTDADMSEDILYLNVQTPAKKTTERLPVMVWIHGGGLGRYSGNFLTYNFPNLAQTGKVVVVTISHRLGPFGYMAHPQLSAESERGVSGNYGQLDLIAALQWVKKNIVAFGGDPHRVMIWGQSGGGSKVNGLVASPLAKGLFHRASCQSGFTTSGTPLATAEQYGVNLMNKVGASSIAEMRSKPWQEIIKAANTAGSGYTDVHVVDGWYLPDTIGNIFMAGTNNDVPYMVGYCGGEITASNPARAEILRTMSKKQHSPIYTWVFTHVPSNWKAQGLKAYHTLELRYIFGDLWTIATQFNSSYCCPPYVTDPDPGINELDDQMLEIMEAMWTQFAATGNPSVRGLVNWPAYDNCDLYLDIGLPLWVRPGLSTLVEGQPAR